MSHTLTSRPQAIEEITKAKIEQVMKRIADERRSGDPESPVNQAIKKWEGHDFTVKVNDQWRLEGFIEFFMSMNDLLCAADPTWPRSLKPQCFDPVGIARLCGFPVEEFAQFLPPTDSYVIGGIGEVKSAVEQLTDSVKAVLPIVQEATSLNPNRLSDNKRSLYEAASETGPMIGKEICRRASIKYGGYARGLLTDLVEAGFLRKVRGGYQRVSEGQKS
jgi:hypothetical protein